MVLEEDLAMNHNITMSCPFFVSVMHVYMQQQYFPQGGLPTVSNDVPFDTIQRTLDNAPLVSDNIYYDLAMLCPQM